MAKGNMVHVSLKEIKNEFRKIGQINDKQRTQLNTVFRSATNAVFEHAKRRVPQRRDISAKSSLKGSLVQEYDSNKMEGIVRAKAPHAHLIEFGVKPALSYPIKKNNLAMMHNGHVITPHNAMIPGRPAQPFLRPSFEQEKPRIISEVKKVFK